MLSNILMYCCLPCLDAHSEGCGRVNAERVGHAQSASPAEKHAGQVFRKLVPPRVVAPSARRLRIEHRVCSGRKERGNKNWS